MRGFTSLRRLLPGVLLLIAVGTQAQESTGAYVAYTYADQPTAASYTPQAAFTFNPEGGATIRRTATGVYVVSFDGLAAVIRDRSTASEGETGSRGHVQISTVNTPGAYCKTTGWGESATTLVVNVACFDASGAPTDARFNALVLEPAIHAGELGFVFGNEQGEASYSPSGAFAYNSTGGGVEITRLIEGSYLVRFEGMARYASPSVTLGGEILHATAFGSGNVDCRVTGWNLQGDDVQAFVGCRPPGGRLADSRFTLMALWPGLDAGRHAYAFADQSTATADYTPTSAFNDGRPVTVSPLGVGHYRVWFSGLTVVFGGHVQVGSRSDSRTCQAEGWGPSSGNLRVDVRCYDSTGSSANAPFVVSAHYGAAPAAGVDPPVVNFSGFSDGDLLAYQLNDRGVQFSNGAIIESCASDNAVCARSRSARNVVAPPDLPTEFRRDELAMRFASPQTRVTASVNSAVQDGQERTVRMVAFGTRGAIVDEATGTVQGTPGWTTRLSVSAPDIYRVEVTSRRAGDAEDDNQIILDDLYYTDTSPFDADDSPPVVRLWNPGGSGSLPFGKVYTESPLGFYIQAFDQGLDRVSVEVIREADGGYAQPPTQLCGSPTSGPCGSAFGRDIAVSVSAPGDYRIIASATNAAGLESRIERVVKFDPPDPPPPAFVHRVEFNQSVTPRLYERNVRLSDDVLLIPGKNLLVRYYLHSEEAPRDGFAASLQVQIRKSTGAVINRTLSPNVGAETVNLIPLPEDVGDARRDTLVTMRANLARTLNFAIPGDWLLDADFVELVLWEGVRELSRAQIADVGANHSTLALQVVYLNEYQHGSLGPDTFNEKVRPYLEQALPFSEVTVLSERGFDFVGDDPLGLCYRLLYGLSWYGDDFGSGLPTDTRLFWTKMLFADDLLGDCGGLGQRPGTNSISLFNGSTAAHEAGHNVGLKHASNVHGEGEGGSVETWPYFHGAIGRTDGAFGVILEPLTEPGLTDGGTWDAFVVDPCPTTDLSVRFAPMGCGLMADSLHGSVPHEVMSYGGGWSLDASSLTDTGGAWPSDLTYWRFFSATKPPSMSIAPVLASTSAEARIGSASVNAPPEVLIATAIVRPDGTSEVLPLAGRTATLDELARQLEGDVLVELLGGDVVLASTTIAESELADGDEPLTFLQALLPYVQGVTGVRFSKEGAVVAEARASAHAPTVRILTPNGAEHVTGDTLTVQWEGSDADGDELTYVVEYTPDNGASWETVRVVFPGQPSMAEVSTSGLAEGIRGRVRVTASDGILLARDLSDGYFSVGSQPPVTSFDIYTVDASTGARTRVTYLDETDEYNPAWSPMGRLIVHDVVRSASDGSTVGQDLYITDLSAGTSSLLVGGEGGNDAAWHPDGSEILFDRCAVGAELSDCEPSLYRLPASGGTPTRVREDATDGDWAHTGQLIVFHQPSDGSIRTRHLVSGREWTVATGTNPVWSPNDKYVAYTHDGDLYRIRVNGSGKPLGAAERLTRDAGIDSQPSWMDSDRSLVFHSDRSGSFDLYTVSVGGPPVFLTGTGEPDYDPAADSRGETVAYSSFTLPFMPTAAEGLSESAPGHEQRLAAVAEFDVRSYPNPFSESTTIQFGLPDAVPVRVTVFDALGRQIASLVDGSFEAGTHAVRFDARGYPSGVYLVRVQAGAESLVHQIVLTR